MQLNAFFFVYKIYYIVLDKYTSADVASRSVDMDVHVGIF